MASGGGMMGGPQADPQKAFEVSKKYVYYHVRSTTL